MSFFTSLLLVTIAYVSPVHFDVLLSGNFGEPRPNHFHGGIDIKTQQVEGKAIYSIGDGYVSRVTVDDNKYGNAVYVKHPDGYTSVYMHLQRFAPFIEAKVRKWQYAHHTEEVDMKFEARECPVAQGQLIALSGDTGASMGPHLHLTIFRSDNWHLMDPLAFIPGLLKDTLPPVASAIMAYPQAGEGMVCMKNTPQRFDFNGKTINDSIFAWGKVGFALLAHDVMNGSSNKLGVRFTRLTVDNKEVYKSDVDDIPMDANQMVNIWGDYNYFMRKQEWFLKSFIAPGNALPFLKTGTDKGIVDFNEKRAYHLSYVLCDFYGNQEQYSFTVYGKPDSIAAPEEPADSVLFRRGEENHAELEGMALDVPKEALLFDAWVKPAIRDTKRYSGEVAFAPSSVPLYTKAKLRIRLRKEVPDKTKVYVAARKLDERNPLDFDKETFLKTTVDDGWALCDVNDIGEAFVVAYDDTPPRISPVSQKAWDETHSLYLDIRDEESGINSMEAFIDGQFVLFEHVKRSSHMVCHLRQTPVAPTGGDRQLTVKANDRCGNVAVFDTKIHY